MSKLTISVLKFLLAVPLVAAHNFPYVPTQILPPSACIDSTSRCDGQEVAYIFHQASSSSTSSVVFRAVNLSLAIQGNVQLDTPTTELPFLKGKTDTTTFGAARTGNGTLVVYAGDCEGKKGEVWTYTHGNNWVKGTTGDDGHGPRGPYFLGGTVAFSSTLAPEMDRPTIYTYGGMCAQPKPYTDDWQSSGNYTKTMMSIGPQTDKTSSSKRNDNANKLYELKVASNSGPRTPIAGFTLTPLTPSMTNRTGGVVTQQASYVLLGGHTAQAFINMSTAAVWNLPAESWTYVDIQAPDSNGDDETDHSSREPELLVKGTRMKKKKKVIKKRTANNVYSRSGHTAVLSEDGGSVVVFGGWAGNVNTPAVPQLAVLEMSEAYSSWKWTIPEKQPDGGIYGHGAAVLPGNVMMVYGGWETKSDSSKTKRETGSGARFLNLTSMSWQNSYQNPNAASSGGDSDPHNAPSESGLSVTQRIGLGLGLGLGAPLLFALLFVFFCWRSRHNKQRDVRDRTLRALSQDMTHFRHDTDEMMERDRLYMSGGNGGYLGGAQGPYGSGYEGLRGDGNAPLPLPIPRKPTMSRQMRGGYVPTPTNFASNPGGIHPIYEDDEEEPYQQGRAQMLNNTEAQTPVSETGTDPFLTPIVAHPPTGLFAAHQQQQQQPPPPAPGSATPSPEGPRHDPEVQDWVSDVDAADAILARMNSARHGRSPTRRNSHRSANGNLRDDEDRNGSNLSESARSMADSLRGGPPSPTARRQQSPGSNALLAGSTLLNSGDTKPSSSGSSSFSTAKFSFNALQAEGPGLLLGGGGRMYGDGLDEPPGSPSKSKPRKNWLGSLRRVFSSSGNTTPMSDVRPEDDLLYRRRSFEHEGRVLGGDYEPGLVGMRGELLRRKQGRQDWEGIEDEDQQLRRAEKRAAAAAAGLPTSDSDWDIEKAIEQRLVQVMFTVPKERLRVVNADDEEKDDEEGGVVVVKSSQEVIIVDPEKESLQSEESRRREEDAMGGHHVEEEEEEELGKQGKKPLFNHPLYPGLHQPPPLEFPQEEEQDIGTSHQHHHHHQQHEHEQEREQGQHHHLLPSPIHHRHHTRHPSDVSSTLLRVDTGTSLDLPPRLSFETTRTDDSLGRRSEGVVMEAQAMSMTRERPRTRVLQMVDSFESLGKERDSGSGGGAKIW